MCFRIFIKNFRARAEKKPSLEIPELGLRGGDFCALIAKSGVGKSLLLSLLAGSPPIYWLNKKSVSFDKFSICGHDFKISDFYSPRKIRNKFIEIGELTTVYLPQILPLMEGDNSTALDNFCDAFLAISPETKSNGNKLERLFRKKDKNFDFKSPLAKLSGGERKRGELICRLCAIEEKDTQNLLSLLDEPTSGFDAITQRKFIGDLKKKLDGKKFLTVVATHALAEIKADVFNKIIFCKKHGNSCIVNFSGSLENFCGGCDLEHAFEEKS